MAENIRADVFLFEFGYTKSRENAKKLIEQGKVRVDGSEISKPSHPIDTSCKHIVEITADKYVCRGGLKLEFALEHFGVDVSGLVALDVGASTGGFTDCLLQHGAKKVYAVDSGHGQLAPSLLERKEVINLEGVNARGLTPLDFKEKFDIAVMDVSFISQTLIIPVLPSLLSERGFLISLIKPQFEAGRAAVGKNGIVKKLSDREAAISRVLLCARENGFTAHGLLPSPIKGGDGNCEFLAWFKKESTSLMPISSAYIREAVKKGQ